MTYSDKVKASKGLLEAIKALGNDEHIIVQYGTNSDGEPQRYRIKCSIWKHSGPSYSIHKDDVWALDGMNIDKFTGTTARAYTYDMMSQRTQYTFPLYMMEVVEQPFKEQSHDLKF